MIFALMLWFVSTGAIIWLDARPRWTFRWSLGVAGLIAVAAVYGLVRSSSDTSTLGAYCAFTCALGVWGWHEMAFLMGFVTGPRRLPCPADATGFRRFRMAAATLMYHEIALALNALGLAALTWRQPNQTGTLTFALLFVLRLSTKFNIFAGVPNLTEDFLPPHLDYLKSYFRKGPVQPVFAVSLLVATGISVWAATSAINAINPTGFILLFTLAALGILEHGFLALPVADAALWRWAISAKPVISPAIGTK